MNSKLLLSLIILFDTFLIYLGYVLLGFIPAIVFSIFLFGGLIVWLFTTFNEPVNPTKIVVPYLITVIFFIVHVFEEYKTEFWNDISYMMGVTIPEFNFLLVAAFIGPILWLTGLILFYLKTEIGNYLFWAFIFAMIISELAHFVFPFIAYSKFTYFPGMYTAILPLFPALYCAYLAIQQSKINTDVS